MRRRRPREIVIAVPAASAMKEKHLEKVADGVVTGITGYMPHFNVSDFYRYWHVLSDNEGFRYLKEWHLRRFGPDLETLQEK